MTHPACLPPEEAVEAIMWILMCSNDLSFVLGSSHLPGRASGITCESDVIIIMRALMQLMAYQRDMPLHNNALANLVTLFMYAGQSKSCQRRMIM